MRIVTALVNGREQLSGEDSMSQRFLIAVDDRKVPGKVEYTFVRFETELLDTPPDAKRLDFLVLQPDQPEAAALRRLLAEK